MPCCTAEKSQKLVDKSISKYDPDGYEKLMPASEWLARRRAKYGASERSDYSRYDSYRRPGLATLREREQRKSFYQKHTGLCWGIIGITVVLVFGIALTVGLYFGMRKTEETTTTTAAPVKTLVKFHYSIDRSKAGDWYVANVSQQPLMPGDEPKCDDWEKLGVCPNGQCAAAEDKSSDSDGQWEDNCDEENPCWQGDKSMIIEQPVSRNQCISKMGKCSAVSHAVVWMQHLRCKVGTRGKSPKDCTGFPMRLWMCKDCQPDPRKYPCEGNQNPSNPCAPCQGNPLYYAGEFTGHKCNHPSGSKGYCWQGQCFLIHGDAQKTPPKECKKKS